MSIRATIKFQVDAIETLETNVPAAAAPLITHDGLTVNHALDVDSTPPATKIAAFQKDLVDGAGTIDLTALTGTNGATVDGTGSKVQALLIRALNTNANPITIADGAVNGYQLGGNGWQVALAANQEFAFYGNDATPDVAAGAKTLDLTGTGTQSLKVVVILG